MNAVKELLKVAEKIENRFRKLAQMVSAQPSDIEAALRQANLWDLSNQVAPLLNSAGVPESAAVKINIVVDKNLQVHFVVDLTPTHASAVRLAGLLRNAYGSKMNQALAAAKLTVADTITLNWMTF